MQYRFLVSLCSGPRKLKKLLKPTLGNLRLQQVTKAGFADDSMRFGKNFAKWERNVHCIVTHLDDQGFLVHSDKSIFVAIRPIEYLDFKIDSKLMTISLTHKKIPHKTVMSGKISDH